MVEVVGFGRVNDEKYWLHEWEGLAAGDTGRSVARSDMADKTVTVTGTFDSETVTLQGSQDNSTWFTMSDTQGASVEFTEDGGSVLVENPRYIRPSVSDAGGTVDVNVRLGASASK